MYGQFLCVTLLLTAVLAEERKAIVVLSGEDPKVKGNVTLHQTDKVVSINGMIEGLKPGKHGFHIHEFGDISAGCGSTGKHFNPYNKNHGAPTDTERHVGDLGNIEADNNGIAKITMSDSLITLSGPNSIIGRAVVVHSDLDDLGKGGYSDSLTTGHAGSRVACGLIGTLDKGTSSVSSIHITSFLLLLPTFLLLKVCY